jgi:hypothetical protein
LNISLQEQRGGVSDSEPQGKRFTALDTACASRNRDEISIKKIVRKNGGFLKLCKHIQIY